MLGSIYHAWGSGFCRKEEGRPNMYIADQYWHTYVSTHSPIYLLIHPASTPTQVLLSPVFQPRFVSSAGGLHPHTQLAFLLLLLPARPRAGAPGPPSRQPSTPHAGCAESGVSHRSCFPYWHDDSVETGCTRGPGAVGGTCWDYPCRFSLKVKEKVTFGLVRLVLPPGPQGTMFFR